MKNQNQPLCAKNEDEAGLLCRFAFDAPSTAVGEMMYMPAGTHSITPSQNGRAVRVEVFVDASAAAALESQRASLAAKGKKPYFDFNHEDREASFWPVQFFWKDSPAPGVYARGEWTDLGETGIKGKRWRQFSPVFHVDNVKATPARIVSRDHAKPNMGGLVNDPAFTTISPLWARSADGADSIQNTNQKTNMSDTNTAQLKAKISELESAALQRAEQDADAAIMAAINRGAIAPRDEAGRQSWKRLIVSDPSNAELLAKVPGNPALESGRRTTSSPRVERGQISGIDSVRAYAAVVARNAAIKETGSVEKAKLAKEAAAIFASEMKGNEDSWMGVPLDHDSLKATDVTSATIGTLAGTLVLQRNLPLLKFSYPMLQTLFSDFSDQTGRWGQTEKTRIPIKPAVTEYDATNDANGRPKGFVVVVPPQSVDVDITLSKHVGIPMVFGVQTLASTIRNLFAEQSAGAINALGGYFVNMATALMTSTNFNAYAQVTDAACGTTSGSTAITLASTAGVYPGQEISGTGIPTGAHIASVVDGTNAIMTLAATATATVTATLGAGKVPELYPTYVKALADFNFASLGEIGAAFDHREVPYMGRNVMLNAAYYQRLAQDETFNTFFAATRNPEIIGKGLLPELNNFTPQKAPFFPTSNNRVGFAYHAAAIALKSRLPQDFTQAVSAMVPGSITTVTDPDTGLSVLHVERVDVVGRYAESCIEVMLGANLGDRRAGLVLTSA